MKPYLLASLLVGGLMLASYPNQAFAQSRGQAKPAETGSYIPWFTVQNKAMVLQSGSKIKPLDKDVTLPNGMRVDYRAQSVVLADGKRVVMKEGDMLSLNGEFIHKGPVEEEAVPVATPAVVDATGTPAPPAAAAPAFSYEPAAPVNGKLKAVVEVGATGLNSFIIRVDEKHNWKLEKSAFADASAPTSDDQTVLRKYIGAITGFGVSETDIYFVANADVAAQDGPSRVIKALEALKHPVTAVTPECEGGLSLRAVLPPGYAKKAFVVDLGAANTKIAWLEDDEPKTVATYGSQDVEKSADATVAGDITTKASQVPAALRGTCFILGSTPLALAKSTRQGQELYTTLQAPASYPADAQTKAGLSIYQTVAAATGCQQFVFAYDTYFPIGYLLSLP